MATSPHIATAPRIARVRVAPRLVAAVAVAGAIAGGVVAAANSDTDHSGPVTAGRTAVAHPDVSARHNGHVAVRVVK
jgi:hypothetical protein